MEGAGSRDISNYYLGGVMPSSLNRSMHEEGYSSGAASDPLSLVHSSAREVDLNAVGNAFNVNLGTGSLNLSAEEQSTMMKSIQEIFDLEEEDEEMTDGDGDEEEEEPVVDLEDQMRRTERLKGVLSTLAQLWWSDSEHMDLVAEKLADGSRDREWLCSILISNLLHSDFRVHIHGFLFTIYEHWQFSAPLSHDRSVLIPRS